LIFADASFLVSLYLPNDRFSGLAKTVAANFESPVAYPLLTEVELTNTVWRAVGEKRISKKLGTALLRDVHRDLVDGFLQQSGLDAVAHYRRAIELSERYAAQYLTRALDVLHVAAACILETRFFASFDIRQRQLATVAGLKLLPTTFNPPARRT
jgi:predicted nucleic acid-binding protein